MTTFTVRDLTKAGFVHNPSGDFRDDGTNFRSYKLDGIEVTYAKDDENAYLSINSPDNSIAYNDYRMFPSYNLMNEFNGVDISDVNIDKLVQNVAAVKKDFDTFKAGGKVYEDDVEKMTIDELRVFLQKKHLSFDRNNKADKVFDLAWDYGHSSGHGEVESYYIDFAELAK